ncbi:hypothetical protein JCM15765_15990 [Paradesulfitobacterium aromaticivorans]
MRTTPQEILDLINDPSFSMLDQWQVQKQAIIQLWADVYVYSALPEEQVRKAMLKPCADIAQTVQELRANYGPDCKIAVMPLGPLTIP